MQQLTKNGRIRTRYLLPMELMLYAIVLLIACLAILPDNAVRRLLEARGMETEWLLCIGGAGGCGLALVVFEWLAGSAWPNDRLERSCYLRAWSAIVTVGLGVWIVQAAAHLPSPFMIGLGLLITVFALWSWWANRRAFKLLSPRFCTAELEHRLQSRSAFL